MVLVMLVTLSSRSDIVGTFNGTILFHFLLVKNGLLTANSMNWHDTITNAAIEDLEWNGKRRQEKVQPKIEMKIINIDHSYH